MDDWKRKREEKLKTDRGNLKKIGIYNFMSRNNFIICRKILQRVRVKLNQTG